MLSLSCPLLQVLFFPSFPFHFYFFIQWTKYLKLKQETTLLSTNPFDIISSSSFKDNVPNKQKKVMANKLIYAVSSKDQTQCLKLTHKLDGHDHESTGSHFKIPCCTTPYEHLLLQENLVKILGNNQHSFWNRTWKSDISYSDNNGKNKKRNTVYILQKFETMKHQSFNQILTTQREFCSVDGCLYVFLSTNLFTGSAPLWCSESFLLHLVEAEMAGEKLKATRN